MRPLEVERPPRYNVMYAASALHCTCSRVGNLVLVDLPYEGEGLNEVTRVPCRAVLASSRPRGQAPRPRGQGGWGGVDE